MKRAFITHATENYLDIAKNLATSIELFSKFPIIVCGVNCSPEAAHFFKGMEKVLFRNLDLELDEDNSDNFTHQGNGNFYVTRENPKIYKILCAKTAAIQLALEEGFEELCYLDSDCIASPIIDEMFDWMPIVKDYPICTEGIHQYMIIVESNGFERGNPFEGCWPETDLTKTLEWPLMQFLEMPAESRGTYRTTNIILCNSSCLNFIKTWKEFCFLLPKLKISLSRIAAFHEETIYNVLSWKKTNEGFPLCYINLRDGIQTVRHFYEEGHPGFSTWMSEENKDYSLNFYRIPPSKRDIKVLHGEKRTEEFLKILDYLKHLQESNYFNTF